MCITCNSIHAELLPFISSACTLRYTHKPFTNLRPCLCFTCGTHECRCYCPHMAEIAFGRFSESVHAAVETVVLNMESFELKTATKANQHHSLFAKSSISSCLIQKTLVFITHTCCTRDTEPTAVRNKHSCGNTIPLSIYITSSLVSMQIKLNPHCVGDLTGTV